MYESSAGRLPPAWVVDPEGKPLLSWRVLILPYIEHEPLFKQFRLDEPWDSPHNGALLDHMPRIYASPRSNRAEAGHHTFYRSFVGKGTAFEIDRVLKLENDDFADGLGSTLLLFEAGEAVPWTKPDGDMHFVPDAPLPKMGGMFPRLATFRVAMVDTTILSIDRTISDESLRALVTRGGGEPDPPELQR